MASPKDPSLPSAACEDPERSILHDAIAVDVVAIDTINRRSSLSQNLDDALRRGGFRRMPEPAEIGSPWLMTSGETLVRLFAATDPSRFASNRSKEAAGGT